MTTFKKTVLQVGKRYRSPDREVVVTKDRLKHWADTFKAMSAAGAVIPAGAVGRPGAVRRAAAGRSPTGPAVGRVAGSAASLLIPVPLVEMHDLAAARRAQGQR